MALMSRLTASDLFFSRLPYIDEILFENLDAPALTYTQVFDVRSSQRAREQMTGYTGFGMFTQKDADGGAISYDQLMQAYDKTFTHLTYAKGFQVSEEGMEDDLDSVISNAAPALGRAAQSSIEQLAWNLFNNSFGTETTPDGQAICSNSHPNVGGGTQDNLVAGDLSEATLESALILMADTKDHRGLPVDVTAQAVVIPTEQQFIAARVLNSEKRPGVADNDINAVNRLGLRVIMSKYLTGDDDTFLLAAPSVAKILFYWRKEPVSDHVMDFETGNMKSKMTFRCSLGAADWRGIVGLQGA
jgi:phage major head subunit gpT-like protein